MPDLMIADTEKPNWLLRGLIFISIGAHLFLLMSMSGRYHPAVPVTIELDLRTISNPIKRDIPRPPNISKSWIPAAEALSQADLSPVIAPENMAAKPLPKPILIPELPEAKEIDAAPGVEKISEPDPVVKDAAEIAAGGETDVSASVGANAAEIQAERDAVEAAPYSEAAAATGENMPSAAAFEAQLRAKIPLIHAEADRLYRKKAQKRQLQGRTVVRVVIDANGDIVALDVAESSQNRILDQIALKAVSGASPFPRPPSGPTTIDIPINFKLI